MAANKKTDLVFSLALSFLILCNGSLAQQSQQSQSWFPAKQQGRGSFSEQWQRECNFDQLSALEPTRRVDAEAGFTEYWDSRNNQFNCAGVSFQRTVIQPGGLLQLSFDNAARLTYIEQGQGITGILVPGCPESFQSFQQSEQQQQQQQQEPSESFQQRDQHQKIHQFRRGDVIALPPGVAHWCYNDGDTPVITVTVFNTNQRGNQLDIDHREFMLAGRQKRSQQSVEEQEDKRRISVLTGFDQDELSEVLRVSKETVRRLQSEDDQRGHIIWVKQGFHVSRPSRQQQQEQCDNEDDENVPNNIFADNMCSFKIRENINDPSRADIFTPRGGRLTDVSSQDLPILQYLQMSAQRGVLYKNAILGPRWNLNAHSVAYVTRGSARVQIVGSRGKPVFDGELRRGQVILVPQNFAVLTKASSEGFEWVTFRTNDNSVTSPIFGKGSVFRSLPVEVIANIYRISREQAWRVKYGRAEELQIFAPRTQIRTSV